MHAYFLCFINFFSKNQSFQIEGEKKDSMSREKVVEEHVVQLLKLSRLSLANFSDPTSTLPSLQSLQESFAHHADELRSNLAALEEGETGAKMEMVGGDDDEEARLLDRLRRTENRLQEIAAFFEDTALVVKSSSS